MLLKLMRTLFFCTITMPNLAYAALSPTATNIAISNAASTITSADFNNDGKADIALADQGTNSITILLGNGNNTFAPATSFTATNAIAFVHGDFNNDAKQDLAFINPQLGSGTLHILLGNGNGSFTAAGVYATGAAPTAIITSDFNGDGKLDLATANQQGLSVSVLLNQGNATFTTTNYTLSGTTKPVDLGSADFNGDGKFDILVTDLFSNTAQLLVGNGLGGFTLTGIVHTFPLAPGGLTIADFNGDGKMDWATILASPRLISIHLGNGNGTFNTPSVFSGGSAPNFIIHGDFNGDGKVDLAISDNISSNGLRVMTGTGTGSFSGPSILTTPATPATAVGLASADFNGDTQADVVVLNHTIQAGISSSIISIFNQQDSTAPVGSILINAGSAGTNTLNVTLNLTCTDNVACTQMQFSNDNITYSALTPYTTSSAWTLSAAGGSTKTVFARFKDAAGNVSAVAVDNILFDTVPPLAPVINTPANGIITASHTRPIIAGTAETGATITIKDGGVSIGLVTATGVNWTLPSAGTLNNGVHTFVATATDAAGNISPNSNTISYTVATGVNNAGTTIQTKSGCLIGSNQNWSPMMIAMFMLLLLVAFTLRSDKK